MSKTRVSGGVLARAALVVVAAIAALACGREQGQARVDVVPSVTLAASVADGEPLQIQYRWEPAAEFEPPAEDYQVFVHLLDADGRILLQDDHFPPQPTSQWRAGQVEEYSRWLYAPRLEVEQVSVVVGLYEAGEGSRALVRAGGDWVDAATVHELQVRVGDMTGEPVRMDGWHSPERIDESLLGQWRWSEGLAHVVFTNPRGDGILHLRAHAPYDEVGAQTLVLRVGEQEIWRTESTAADPFLERIEVPADLMGDDKEWVEVTLEVTPVLVPRELNPESADERQLGLQVFLLYLSPA